MSFMWNPESHLMERKIVNNQLSKPGRGNDVTLIPVADPDAHCLNKRSRFSSPD